MKYEPVLSQADMDVLVAVLSGHSDPDPAIVRRTRRLGRYLRTMVFDRRKR